MRGNPLIRLAIAIVVFSLLGIPVWKLTRTHSVSATAVPSASGADSGIREVTLHVAFDLEEPASKVVLSIPAESNLPSWTFQPGQAGSANWKTSLPKSGADILVEATWPDEKRHAFKINLSAPGYAPVEATFWCNGSLRDVVTLNPQP